MKKFFYQNYNVIIIVILSVVFIVFFIQMFGKAYREGGYDFSSYLLSSKALLNGTNPYATTSPFPYIYPLFLAYILVPLTYLPYNVNNVLWFIINVGAFGWTIFFLTRMIYDYKSSIQKFLAITFFIVLIIINPIQNHLLNGQVDFAVLLCSALFFYWFGRNNILSNMFLAIAISLKIVPLIFLIFLFIEKKYWDILLTILFSLVFILLLPYFFNGAIIFDHYSYYINNFILGSFSGSHISTTDTMYFTLFGFITHVFNIPDSLLLYLKIICAFLIILPIGYLHFQLVKSNVSNRKMIIFSLLSLSILLISPSSQTHHLIFLIPALFVIIINFFSTDGNKIRSIIYYITFFVLFWIGSVFKYPPFIFISIITLFIIILFDKNNFIILYE